MKQIRPKLSGKTIFYLSLAVITFAILTVYTSGLSSNRSLETNSYLALSIIWVALFLFLFYGLYKGISLTDDFPRFQSFKSGDLTGGWSFDTHTPDVQTGGGLGGILISIALWIGIALLIIVLSFLLEAFLWVSFFVLLSMLYWVFYRALTLVLNKSANTSGDLAISALYAGVYSFLYLSWMLVIVYLIEVL